MCVLNFIKLSAAVHELSWSQRRKNSDENDTVRRYGADSNERTLVSYEVCLMTSGAIQKGVPTKVSRLLVVFVS